MKRKKKKIVLDPIEVSRPRVLLDSGLVVTKVFEDKSKYKRERFDPRQIAEDE